MKPRKHAELIKAWADGATIEFRWPEAEWKIISHPQWEDDCEYRVWKEPKPDIEFNTHIKWNLGWYWVDTTSTEKANLRLSFDAETGQLKSAEVIK